MTVCAFNRFGFPLDPPELALGTGVDSGVGMDNGPGPGPTLGVPARLLFPLPLPLPAVSVCCAPPKSLMMLVPGGDNIPVGEDDDGAV